MWAVVFLPLGFCRYLESSLEILKWVMTSVDTSTTLTFFYKVLCHL